MFSLMPSTFRTIPVSAGIAPEPKDNARIAISEYGTFIVWFVMPKLYQYLSVPKPVILASASVIFFGVAATRLFVPSVSLSVLPSTSKIRSFSAYLFPISSHSDQAVFDYSGENDYFKISSPYIDAKATLDVFEYVRLMSRFSFQRLEFQQMDWADDWNSLEGKDDTQTITTFRAGLELLSKKGNKARVKGGIYRQMEWNKSTYRDNTESESKWVFSFGTEM